MQFHRDQQKGETMSRVARQSPLSFNRSLRLAALLSTSVIAGMSFAQSAQAQTAPAAPVRSSIDGNGVDLFDGTLSVDAPSISLGDNENGISYHRWNRGSGWTDSSMAFMNLSGSIMTVAIGEASDSFTVSGSTYTSTEGNGSTLTYNSTTLIYTYTRNDGTVARFNKTRLNEWVPYGNNGLVLDITNPKGESLSFSYGSVQYCAAWKPSSGSDICLRTTNAYRMNAITSSYGYRLTPSYDAYEYFYDIDSPSIQPDFVLWSTPTSMGGLNLASSATTVLVSQSFGDTVNAGVTSYVVTDQLSRQAKYRMSGAQIVGITRPGASTEDVTIAYTLGKVSSVTTPIGTTSYGRSDAGNVRTVTVTDPGTHVSTFLFDIPSRRMTSVTDPLGRTSTMIYDTSGRVTRSTAPEGNYVQFTRDARGNVTEQRAVSKTPGTPPDIVTTASYPASCTNIKTCNQPDWTKDALLRQTDYTYDATHGGVLTVTAPAPATIRPQTRYSYTGLQAYYANTSGSIVASGQIAYRLTGVSQCRTTASCTAGADETKVTISYGPQTAGVGNNLLPVSATVANGTGTLTATTAVAYDGAGNVTSVDGPLAGAADTTAYRYDALRRPLGSIAPDPDGAGALQNAASRVTYDALGRVNLSEQGTTAGQSDTAWAGFTPAASTATTYSAADQKLTVTTQSGATAYAKAQYSYDSEGRVDCTALRMNTAVYAALPASACTASTLGSAGPDRIAKYAYDAASQLTSVQSAFGTTNVSTEGKAYSVNGGLLAVADAEGNKTSYEYDGHDRLVKTWMPTPAKGTYTSSTTDYEQLTYDAASNVTQRRLRDGNTIAIAYDNLNRPTSITGATIPGRTLTYNLLGMNLTATFSTGGQSVTNVFDGLGRITSHASPQGTISYLYDSASRRTRTTWADAFYVSYDYDTLGRVTTIRENGAASGVGVLANYSYDSLGRRTGVTYGNGTSQTYAYDPLSRLEGLKTDLASTTADQLTGRVAGIGTPLAYNPASQLAAVTRSNDAYAWSAHYNADRAYIANGLNQYSTVAGAALTYDARGNLTASAGTTYAYNGLNQLTSVSGGFAGTLAYDPADRLYQLISGASTTRFQYDGASLVAEFNGANAMLRRYVHGPGVDEPLVWYEGPGTTNRRFLQADERGSVVAVSDSSGASLAINRYDEYGIPQTGNLGRFSYTGQTALPEIGLLSYKARMYSPGLGRFMQTDPIGYGDGLNWYNYVKSDPVNGTDSSGLTAYTCDSRGRCTDENGNPIDPNSTRLGAGDTVTTRDGTFTSNGQGGGWSDTANGRSSYTPGPGENPGFRSANESILYTSPITVVGYTISSAPPADLEGYRFAGSVNISPPVWASFTEDIPIGQAQSVRVVVRTVNFNNVQGRSRGIPLPIGAFNFSLRGYGDNARFIYHTGTTTRYFDTFGSTTINSHLSILATPETIPDTTVSVYVRY